MFGSREFRIIFLGRPKKYLRTSGLDNRYGHSPILCHAVTSGVQRWGERGDGPGHPRQGGIQRV